MHLADVHAGLGAQHLFRDIGESGDAARPVGAELAVILGLYLARGVFLDIAARHDPFAAFLFEAGADVDRGIGVGIGAGGVVDADAGLAALEIDLAHGDAHAAAAFRADLDLAAAADRAGGHPDVEFAVDVGHAKSLLESGARTSGPAIMQPGPLPPPMLVGSGSTGRRTSTALSASWLPGDAPRLPVPRGGVQPGGGRLGRTHTLPDTPAAL